MTRKLAEFRLEIQQQKRNHTYDELAEIHRVNKYYLWHMLKNDSYVPPNRVLRALDIPALIPAPACVKCGNVHTTKKCTQGAVKKNRARRVAVRCDDMRSAANTLLNNLDDTQIVELIGLLQKGGET